MAVRYRIRQFSRLTGVTVRALQIYDRLGLLSPSRTDARHRVYTAHHLDRVGQILALKFLGVPLKQIKDVLDSGGRSLTALLRQRIEPLESQRDRLDRAIGAIRRVEEQLGADAASDARLLAQLVEVIGMNDEAEAMRQYFSARAWAQFQHYCPTGHLRAGAS